MNVIRLFIGLIFFFSHCALAQDYLYVRDTDTQRGVEGAQVIFSTTDGLSYGITDGQGRVLIPELPTALAISHVAYDSYQDTLFIPDAIFLTPSTTSLNDVVVTGQFEPQSVSRSVFTVKSINNQQIEAQAAVNLADALNYSLNLSLVPNKAAGSTSVSMLGLDGQYVKVLIDGVPFPGINGNGNDVDITQINLNNIERIEIVEGPMAVSYGANAQAGVINLITKDGVSNTVFIQEETVGDEYGMDKGRHIQSIALGHQWSDNFFVQADYLRNDFKGYLNEYMGKEHQENDSLRGYDWQPKLQHSAGLAIGWSTNAVRLKYHGSYFHQTLDRYSRIVHPDEHPSSGLTNPYALDTRNINRRLMHTLTANGTINQVSFDAVTAYSRVKMTDQTIRYRIKTDTEEEITKEDQSYLSTVTSRGNFTNLLNSDKAQIELGYEYTYEALEDATIENGEQSLHNIALFASTEWVVTDGFTLRPGLRTTINSKFSAPLIYSLNLKNKLPGGLELRSSIARAYRTPNLTELYYRFVDTNHNVTGNPDLTPEDGYGLSFDFKKNYRIAGAMLTSSFKLFYNDIQDKITLSIVNEEPLKYQYINVDEYKSKGLTLSSQLEAGRFRLGLGLSYIGRYNDLTEDEPSLDEFLYSPEVNANANYSFRNEKWSLALFYKYTGAVEQFVRDGDGSYTKGQTESFNMLDLTTTWQTTRLLSFQAGIRNLLDVKDLQTTAGQAGAHTAANTSVGLNYGRSYFLKATYNF